MRVLVIEDDEVVARALERGLGAEGFDVDHAPDGDTGVWMATEHEYTAIVLDVLLPGRNGFKVCSDLRADGIVTPILMLTAKSGEYDEAEGLDAGADDYLTKPFSFVVLAARLRAILRRSGPREAVIQVIGDLEIDFDRRSASRAGRDISLTNREFTLLEVMARQPKAVCSKDFLLEQVWGPDFTGGHNVVEVYVGYLRRKIDTPGETKMLHTARGHGYRLVP